MCVWGGVFVCLCVCEGQRCKWLEKLCKSRGKKKRELANVNEMD